MKKAVKRWEFWVSIVGFVIAAGLLAFSVYYTADKSSKLSSYIHINATTVDYKLVSGGHGKDKHSNYFAVVQYQVDGVTYTARDMMSVGIGDGVGKLKEIAYNPDDPAECLFVKSEKSFFAFLSALQHYGRLRQR